jgi:hypothetical protein
MYSDFYGKLFTIYVKNTEGRIVIVRLCSVIFNIYKIIFAIV